MLNRKSIVLPSMISAALLAASAGCVRAANSPDEVAALKAQIAELQAKVTQLERQQAPKPAHQPQLYPRTNQMTTDDFFENMDQMQQQMDAMMAAPFMGMGMPARGMMRAHAAAFTPDYDVKASDKEYLISFDMPGMDKSKINVEVKEGMLFVSGERSSESKEDEGGKFYRQERSFGYFSRAIPIPEDARTDSLQAKYDNGVLKITIPRKEAAKAAPAKQKIEVK